MNNDFTKMQMTTARQKPKFSVAITTPVYQKLISDTIKDPKRVARFIASITSAVAINPALQECDAGTILSGALLGESLELSPSPQLGHYYLVPFKDKNRGGKVAQFQLGYKGYIQLAIRAGVYKKLHVLPLKKGELIRFDPLNEEIEVRLIEDDVEREKAETVGFYAMFEYLNGFRKVMYWSKEKMIAHADRYSQAFSSAAYKLLQEGKIPQSDMWRYSSFWYKDFDAMGCKTMLRQLISKWGIMSVELRQAFESDMGVVEKDGTISFVEEDLTTPYMEAEVVPQDEPQEPKPEARQVSLDDL